MKIALPAAVLALGAAALSPLAIGLSARGALEDYAAELSELPGYGVEVERYDLGWLGSRAVMRVRVEDPALRDAFAQAAAEGVPMPAVVTELIEGVRVGVDVAHGPVLLDGGPALALYHAQINLLGAPDGQASTIGSLGLNADLRMGLGGDGTLRVRLPGMSVNDGLEFVSFGGMDVSNRLSGYGSRVDIEGRMERLEIGNLEGGMVVEPLTFSGNSDLSQGYSLVTGEWRADGAGMRLSGDGMEMRMDGMHVEASLLDAGAGNVDLRYGVSVDTVHATGMDEPLRNLMWAVGVQGMNRQALLALQQAAADMDRGLSPEEVQARMLPLLSDLFIGGPRLSIERIGFEMGEDIFFESTGSLFFGEAAKAALAVNPLMTFSAVDASADISFSPGLLTRAMELYLHDQFAGLGVTEAEIPLLIDQQRPQFDATFDHFVQAGYLRFDGERYSVSATLAEGELLINGAALPFPLF